MRFRLQFLGIALVSLAAFSFAGCGTSPDGGEDSSSDSGSTDGEMHNMDHMSDGHDHDQAAGDAQAKIKESLDQLSAEDRALAEKQKTCPVTGAALGKMGKPLKIKVEDREVFICCPDCEDRIREEPEKYFAKLAEQK